MCIRDRSKGFGHYLNGTQDEPQIQVNLLELFNYYVVETGMASPEGFFHLMSRRPPIKDDKPQYRTVSRRTVKAWFTAMHG